MDGLEQDVFDGQGGAVVDIELAVALGLADMDPVGGSVAGAVETSRVTEGLQEHGTLPVAGYLSRKLCMFLVAEAQGCSGTGVWRRGQGRCRARPGRARGEGRGLRPRHFLKHHLRFP